MESFDGFQDGASSERQFAMAYSNKAPEDLQAILAKSHNEAEKAAVKKLLKEKDYLKYAEMVFEETHRPKSIQELEDIAENTFNEYERNAVKDLLKSREAAGFEAKRRAEGQAADNKLEAAQKDVDANEIESIKASLGL